MSQPDSNKPRKMLDELLDERDLWDLDIEPEALAETPSPKDQKQPAAKVPQKSRSQVKVIGAQTDQREIPSLPNRSSEASVRSTTVKVLGSENTQKSHPIASFRTPADAPPKVIEPEPFAELAPPASEPNKVEELPAPKAQEVVEPPLEEAALRTEPAIMPVPEAEEPSPDAKLRKKKKRPPVSTLEKVALGLVSAVLIGGAGVTVASLAQVLPFSEDPWAEAEFPISGEAAVLEAVSTGWIITEPDRDGEQQALPVAKLTASGKSQAVPVRVFLEQEDQIIGDPVNLQLKPGETVTYKGTDGIDDLGDFAAYRHQITEPYYLVVMEQTSSGASRSSQKRFARILMSATELPKE